MKVGKSQHNGEDRSLSPALKRALLAFAEAFPSLEERLIKLPPGGAEALGYHLRSLGWSTPVATLGMATYLLEEAETWSKSPGDPVSLSAQELSLILKLALEQAEGKPYPKKASGKAWASDILEVTRSLLDEDPYSWKLRFLKRALGAAREGKAPSKDVVLDFLHMVDPLIWGDLRNGSYSLHKIFNTIPPEDLLETYVLLSSEEGGFSVEEVEEYCARHEEFKSMPMSWWLPLVRASRPPYDEVPWWEFF